jgi:hypothetical protein
MLRSGSIHASLATAAIAVAAFVNAGCSAPTEARHVEPTEELTAPVTAADLLALTNTCKVVSSHSYKLDDGTSTNICALNGALFWKADMDIDCDGKTTTQCNSQTDCCYQNDTAFHNNADQPLTASVTPYIVIPNDFHYSGLDTTNGGNVAAVIYNGKIQYAVFGDTGPTDIIGEASYACAAKLGINPDPSNGGVGGGVTYIQFIGSGSRGSNIEDQNETNTIGANLAAKLIANNGGGGCTKTTCSAQGKNCGSISDGCGGTLSCGSCTSPQTCGGGGTPNVCGTSSLPSGYSSQDIGAVAAAGSASASSGTFTVTGSGADIWGAADEFRYLYKTMSGDVTITARVKSIQNTNAWAKAAVMIRESLNANAKDAFTSLTPSQGVRFQYRTATGGGSTDQHAGSVGTGAAPYWVRLVRSGNNFTSYRSSDGVTWTQVDTTVSITMASTVYVGLAVTSHADGTLATAVFDSVTISTGSTCTPTTCAAQGKNCGSISNGCGGTLNCGSCTSPQTCGGGGTSNVCGGGSTSSCSFSITQNVYDGPGWWGTITFKNNGPAASSNFALSFNVPSGVHCDYAATGWTFSQSGSTCTYKHPGTTLASGASLTMNYSTDSQSFSAATNVVVHDSVCAP